jgi:hypothetical protein
MHRLLFFCQKRACEHSVGADLSALIYSKSWRMAARQQSLLQVMQLMHLLQIRLANSTSPPNITLTYARNHVQNADYPGFSSKVCYK